MKSNLNESQSANEKDILIEPPVFRSKKSFKISNWVSIGLNGAMCLALFVVIMMFAARSIGFQSVYEPWFSHLITMFLLIIALSVMLVTELKKDITEKKYKISSIITPIVSFLLIVLAVVILILSNPYSVNPTYGPIFIPFEDAVQVHWWTRTKQSSNLMLNGL